MILCVLDCLGKLQSVFTPPCIPPDATHEEIVKALETTYNEALSGSFGGQSENGKAWASHPAKGCCACGAPGQLKSLLSNVLPSFGSIADYSHCRCCGNYVHGWNTQKRFKFEI
jgi:hypothetical protein